MGFTTFVLMAYCSLGKIQHPAFRRDDVDGFSLGGGDIAFMLDF